MDGILAAAYIVASWAAMALTYALLSQGGL